MMPLRLGQSARREARNKGIVDFPSEITATLYAMESAPYLGTPEEELAYLRAQVAEKERELAHTGNAGAERPREEMIAEALAAHPAVAAAHQLAPPDLPP